MRTGAEVGGDHLFPHLRCEKYGVGAQREEVSAFWHCSHCLRAYIKNAHFASTLGGIRRRRCCVHCRACGFGRLRPAVMAPSKDRISYYYDADVSTSYYGNNHPMKPHRLAMTHHLVLSYDLHKRMEVYVRRCPPPPPHSPHARHATVHIDLFLLIECPYTVSSSSQCRVQNDHLLLAALGFRRRHPATHSQSITRMPFLLMMETTLPWLSRPRRALRVVAQSTEPNLSRMQKYFYTYTHLDLMT